MSGGANTGAYLDPALWRGFFVECPRAIIVRYADETTKLASEVHAYLRSTLLRTQKWFLHPIKNAARQEIG